MGIALWCVCGLVAFAIARFIPPGKTTRNRGSWIGELCVAIAAAMILGVVATALDFGGFRELDWRAALFAFFGSAAAVGVFRLLTLK